MAGWTFWRGVVVSACLFGVLAAPAAAPAASSKTPCPYVQFMPTVDNLPQIRAATLCLINLARTRNGRKILHTTPALRRTAQNYALDMMHANFFDHSTPIGRTVEDRARAAGYGRGTIGWQVGEIIAWGEGEYSTPQETVNDWLTSPGHRADIMDRSWTDIGIGAAFGAPEGIDGDGYTAATYAVEFGLRGTRDKRPR